MDQGLIPLFKSGGKLRVKTRQTSLKFLILFKSLQFLTLVSRTVTSNDFAEIIQTDTRLDIMLGWNLGVKLYF